MRRQIFGLSPALTLTLALAPGGAFAQPLNQNPPRKTIQCLDAGGELIAAVCQSPASRLNQREYICTCPDGGLRVEVAICAKGQRQPPEGRGLVAARREASRDGSLIGDKLGERPICVAPRGRP